MRYIFLIFFLILLVITAAYFGFRSKDFEVRPINLNKNHMCAVDAMIIINYKGPKAQILWKDGTRSFYCEVREAFYESLDKVKSRQIKAFYVQDFSNLDWNSYIDKWILAQEVYYVVDSDKDGAMGLTYVPFKDLNCAKQFVDTYNGKLLTYNEIDSKTMEISANLLKFRTIF